MGWKEIQALTAARTGNRPRERSGKKTHETDQKEPQNGKKPPHSGKKPNKKVKQVAKKRARELRKYGKLRKKFLEDHPVCEIPVEGCTGIATQVHHAEGRENERLLDVTKFKAACDNCHRKATDHSLQAIKDGRSGSRLKSKRHGKADDIPNAAG